MDNKTPFNRYTKTSNLVPFIVCGVATFFYVYEFFLRVMPGAMTDELMRSFSIDARGLGIMSALFYYGYTPMQIPAGLLLDRFGPRILLTLSMVVCAIGAVAFGLTDHVAIASVARLFIGLVSSFAFVGALVLVSRWFPAQYFALIVGLVQLMGCVGAIVGEAPVAVIVQHIGWRSTMFWSAGVGAIFSVLFWMLIRDHPSSMHQNQIHADTPLAMNEIQRLAKVVKNPQTWAIGLYAFAGWAPITIFADLWGIPYLKVFYQTSTAVAAIAIAVVWIGIAIGGPMLGWWSNKIGNRRLPLLIAAILGLIASLAIVCIPNLSWYPMYLALFFFGVAASAQAVTFGVVQDNNPLTVAGTAVGFNNMAVILGGLLFQPLIGFILNARWDGKMLNGLPLYTTADYRSALILMPICYIIGILASLFLVKETYCKPQYETKANTPNTAAPLQGVALH
jgi:sugar phosphate permease